MSAGMPSFEQMRKTQAGFATQPTRFTRFLRTCILWQLFRFLVINLKMVRVISKSH